MNNHVYHFPSETTTEWLMPPSKAFLFILITYSDDTSLHDQHNWDFGLRGQRNYVRGNLLAYIQQNAIDGLILAGKNFPRRCPGKFDLLRKHWPWSDGVKHPYHAVPKEMERPLSIGRCGLPGLKEQPPFAHKMFVFGGKTRNAENDCRGQYLDTKAMANDPKNVKIPKKVRIPDGCGKDDPILEMRDDVVADNVEKNYLNLGTCPASNKVSSKQAETNNILRYSYSEGVMGYFQISSKSAH